MSSVDPDISACICVNFRGYYFWGVLHDMDQHPAAVDIVVYYITGLGRPDYVFAEIMQHPCRFEIV